MRFSTTRPASRLDLIALAGVTAVLLAAPASATEIPLSSSALDPADFHRAGSRVVFVAHNESNEYSLWASDGTAAGTLGVFDPCPTGCDGSSWIHIAGSTGPLTYFVAIDPSLGPGARNLFRTDGTVGGTHALLAPPDANRLVMPWLNESFAVVGSRLLFRMTAGWGEEIWSTTGLPSTTLPIFAPAPPPSLATAEICGSDETTAYVRYTSGTVGSWLYRFDALPPHFGAPVHVGSVELHCEASIVSGGSLFVPGRGPAPETFALWFTDGSAALGSLIEASSDPRLIDGTQGEVLVVSREGDDEIPSLWITNGSPAGTWRLKQGTRSESFYGEAAQHQFERIGDQVFYFFLNDSGWLELRRVMTNGTGDSLVWTLCLAGCENAPTRLWVDHLGDDLIFSTEVSYPVVRLKWGTPAEPVQFPCEEGCYAPEVPTHLDGSLLWSLLGESEGWEIWSLSLGESVAVRRSNFDHSSATALVGPGYPIALDGMLFLPAQEVGLEGAVPFALPLQSPCEGDDPRTLCLADRRFRVRVDFVDFTGGSGSGFAHVLTSNAGYLWFFDDANIELMLKIVDGSAYNGHFWVYYGALSNVEYWITVEDTVTGHSKTYHNALGEFGSFGDIEALPASGSPLAKDESPLSRSATADASDLLRPLSTTSGTCAPSSTRVCLLNGRFAVEGEWTDFDDNHGVAFAEAMTSDTGYLWFFDPDVAEIVVKLVDGSGFNGKFWVYYGSLSNVEFTIHVIDTVTGEIKPYHNPLGAFGSFGDIEAFPAP